VSSPIEPSRSDIYKPLSADEQGVFSPIGEAESGYQGGAGEGTEPRARMPADRRPRPVSAALPDPPLAAASGCSEFETTAHGSRVATSVAGVPTGSGADIIVIGPRLKREKALSQTQRQAANEWFDHNLYSGLNEQLTGAVVLIMRAPAAREPALGVTQGTISPVTCWRGSCGRSYATGDRAVSMARIAFGR
jgi:hypothetical protein